MKVTTLPIIIRTPDKHGDLLSPFARITHAPSQPGRWVLRLTHNHDDIVYRSSNPVTLRTFAEKYFNESLDWDIEQDGSMWAIPKRKKGYSDGQTG